MEKITMPHGYLRKIVKKSKTNNLQVGVTLGIYPPNETGVSIPRKQKIKESAIMVFEEEKASLDALIAAVEAIDIS